LPFSAFILNRRSQNITYGGVGGGGHNPASNPVQV
jgi:hypothetical protein